MASIKLPIKRQPNSLICVCQTADQNNNVTKKDLSCLNHLDNPMGGRDVPSVEVPSDRALGMPKALSVSSTPSSKLAVSVPYKKPDPAIKSNNAANESKLNDEGIGSGETKSEMKDQNNNEISHQKRRTRPDDGGISARCSNEAKVKRHPSDRKAESVDRQECERQKSVRAPESVGGEKVQRDGERTEERQTLKQLTVERRQRELNRKVINSFLKLNKNQGTIMSNLVKSLPTQLMAIGIASGMPESRCASAARESARINRGSAEAKLIRRDADLNSDLNSGGANNRNHNSKRELASAAHPAASRAEWQPNGNHGDSRTCVVPVGNKKTKKSSLIIVSPFHQKPDKSQIKNNKTEQANQKKRCKLNGQAAVPFAASCDKSSDCLDCVSRASAVQCASGRNCERCDSNGNCKQANQVKRGEPAGSAISRIRMEETAAENKEQSTGPNKVEPEAAGAANAAGVANAAAVPSKPTELASLSKQNSLDSPAKSTSNSTATNSPSIESVWSNLREDYELGEVIGKWHCVR